MIGSVIEIQNSTAHLLYSIQSNHIFNKRFAEDFSQDLDEGLIVFSVYFPFLDVL